MSSIPPYQMNAPSGGPPPPQTKRTAPWVWVLVGLAGMCVICGVVGTAVLFPLIGQMRREARRTISLSNAKQIALSVRLYAADYDDRMPPIDNGPAVAERIEKYLTQNTSGTRRPRSAVYLKNIAAGYTWNPETSKLELATVTNSAKVWIFHSNEQTDAKTFTVGYMDTHAKTLDKESLASLTSVKPIIGKLIK